VRGGADEDVSEADGGEMMTYISKDLSGGKNEILKNDISEEQFKEINECLEYLDTCMYEIDYCLMLRDNIFDFLLNVEEDANDRDMVFVSLNRLFMNIMNSYYAWIEFHEKNFKSIFKPIVSQYYDNHFEYRLAYNLRSFTTHYSLAITSTTTYFDEDKTTINIDLDSLVRKNVKINATFKDELNKKIQNDFVGQDEHIIDAYSFVIKFFRIYERLQGDLWKTISKEIASKVEVLQNYTQNDKTIKDIYVFSEDESTYVRVGSGIALLMKKWKKIIVPDYLLKYLDNDCGT